MRTQWKLVATTVTLVGAVCLIKLVASTLRSEPEARTASILIPGTWGYDVDTMRLPAVTQDRRRVLDYLMDPLNRSPGPRRLEHGMKHFDVEKNFNPRALEFGAGAHDLDIWLQHVSPTEAYLVPKNGSSFVQLGIVGLESVSIEKLGAAHHSTERIPIDALQPGALLGIHTSAGNHALLRIDGYLPRVYRGKDRPDIQRYHLQGTLRVIAPRARLDSRDRSAAHERTDRARSN